MDSGKKIKLIGAIMVLEAVLLVGIISFVTGINIDFSPETSPSGAIVASRLDRECSLNLVTENPSVRVGRAWSDSKNQVLAYEVMILEGSYEGASGWAMEFMVSC